MSHATWDIKLLKLTVPLLNQRQNGFFKMPNQYPDKTHSTKKKKSPRKDAKSYLKYSGMAFEMAAIMGIFTFGGSKLDEKLQLTKNYFTLIGAVLGTILALTFVLKDFIFNKEE